MLGEEFPARSGGLAVVHGMFEPGRGVQKMGALGGRIEAVGVEHRTLIVVAQQDNATLHDQINAFAGIGSIADDIAQAVDFLDLVLFRVLEDRLEPPPGCCEYR